jgi:hypothetical protein
MTTFLPFVEPVRVEKSMRLRQCVLSLAGCLLVSATAHAQTPSTSKVTAEALFEDGRRLMTEGKYAEACPKFAASERLDASTATLLNLASCYERQGRTATAWATYKEAASAANAAGRSDYLVAAERHASGLEPSLPRLTLNVDQPVEGLHVERDGAAVDRAEWGIAIPVDPGSHSIVATAAGHKGWASTVAVTQNGAEVTLTVPALEVLAAEASAPSAPAPVTAPIGVPPAPVEADRHAGASTQTAMAWILAGVGVAGLAIGTGFAVSAKNKYNSTLSQCEPVDPDLCTSQGVSARNDARSQGDVATLAFGIGAAAVVAGAVLWLTVPHTGSDGRGTSLLVAPTLGGAALRGTW